MADQVTGMVKELSAITECSICLEVYKDPRILPCIHTFCLKCIELYADDKNPGEKVPCPVCREKFDIPEEGYSGLRKNFFMSKLIDIKSISSPSSKEKVCDACKEDIEDTECEVPLAESFCVECHQNLCQECSKHHKKNKLTKAHKVIALGSPIDVSEVTRNFPLDLCHHHATKPLEMYCKDCRSLICMLCYAESHHHHKCSGVDRLVPEFRKQMKEDADKVSGLMVEKLKESEVMQKAKSDLLMEFLMAENAIVERDQKLRELLDQQTKSLLEELASLRAEKLKEVGTEIDEMDRLITVMKSYQTYCLNVGETGSAFDICHAVDDLHSRAAQLEKAHESRIKRDVNSQTDLFQPTMLEDFLINNKNIVGKLQDIPVFRTHEIVAEPIEQLLCYQEIKYREEDAVPILQETTLPNQWEVSVRDSGWSSKHEMDCCEKDVVSIFEETTPTDELDPSVPTSEWLGNRHYSSPRLPEMDCCEKDVVSIFEETTPTDQLDASVPTSEWLGNRHYSSPRLPVRGSGWPSNNLRPTRSTTKNRFN